jgi:hypothetical protein
MENFISFFPRMSYLLKYFEIVNETASKIYDFILEFHNTKEALAIANNELKLQCISTKYGNCLVLICNIIVATEMRSRPATASRPPQPWPRLSRAHQQARAELAAMSYPQQEKLHRVVHLAPPLHVPDGVSAPNRPHAPMLSHRCGATAPPSAASHRAEHEPHLVLVTNQSTSCRPPHPVNAATSFLRGAAPDVGAIATSLPAAASRRAHWPPRARAPPASAALPRRRAAPPMALVLSPSSCTCYFCRFITPSSKHRH